MDEQMGWQLPPLLVSGSRQQNHWHRWLLIHWLCSGRHWRNDWALPQLHGVNSHQENQGWWWIHHNASYWRRTRSWEIVSEEIRSALLVFCLKCNRCKQMGSPSCKADHQETENLSVLIQLSWQCWWDFCCCQEWQTCRSTRPCCTCCESDLDDKSCLI